MSPQLQPPKSKNNRCESYKQEFKPMQYCSCHCQLRIIVIPIQIKTIRRCKCDKYYHYNRTQWNKNPSNRFYLCYTSFASCKLITSNFSERIFKSSVVGSATGSPSNSLTVVSSSFAKIISILESGTDKPFSHLIRSVLLRSV